MTRLVSLGFTLALLTAAANLPRLAQGFIQPILPVVGRWADPDAQYRLQLGDVPYDLLRAADAVLPRDASVLLVTSGRDVRRLEYTTFHRALYFLAPRPVWWLSPAPSDGTWESRWWVSAPITPESVRAIAMERGVSYVLTDGLSPPLSIGAKVLERDDGLLIRLDGAASAASDRRLRPAYAGSLWPVQIALAVGIVLSIGCLALAAVARLGYRPAGIEAATLAWALGAGLTSIGMLWLNALGIPLNGQMAILALLAIGGLMWKGKFSVVSIRRAGAGLLTWRRSGFPAISRRSIPVLVLLFFLAVHVAFVAVLAAGRPLEVWDSWVTWGMKARTIFLDGYLSPAVYAEPSRLVTHLDYPLLVPLLETWLYGWLGAPDDRFAGVISVLFYLGLAGICYSAVRRRGTSRTLALAVAVVVASIARVAVWAGVVFADVPLAVLATLAAVYLVEWLSGGPPGMLVIAALSAGLMPWTKREGWVLLAALCVSMLAAGRCARRARISVGVLVFAAALLAGPWWVLLAAHGTANTDFSPITLATFHANLGRLPTIARLLLANLIAADWSSVWPVCVLVVGSLLAGTPFRVRRAERRAVLPEPGPANRVLLATTAIYLGLMSLGYIFSAFVPYQQHIASSVDRLLTHVVALPVLWLAYRGNERSWHRPA